MERSGLTSKELKSKISKENNLPCFDPLTDDLSQIIDEIWFTRNWSSGFKAF